LLVPRLDEEAERISEMQVVATGMAQEVGVIRAGGGAAP
jgi:hypothetical protein